MTDTYFSSRFSNIDAASNPTEFVHYMDDANAMEFFRDGKPGPTNCCNSAPVNRYLMLGAVRAMTCGHWRKSLAHRPSGRYR